MRRTKDAEDGSEGVVGLPCKTIVTCCVNLSAEEREYYDHVESEAQNTLREYLDTDTILRNYSTVLHILLRLRQICNDMELCPPGILQSFLRPAALEGNISSLSASLILLSYLKIALRENMTENQFCLILARMDELFIESIRQTIFPFFF